MKKLFIGIVILLMNLTVLPSMIFAAGEFGLVVNSIPATMFQNETISASYTCTNNSGLDATNVGLQVGRTMEPFSSDTIGSAALTIFSATVDGASVTPVNASPYVDKLGDKNVAAGAKITFNFNLSQHPTLKAGDSVKVSATCVGVGPVAEELSSSASDKTISIKAAVAPPAPEPEKKPEVVEEKDPEEEDSVISKAQIPSEFSVSPNFDGLSVGDSKKIKGLSIENIDSTIDDSCDILTTNNSVEFLEEVDLSDDGLDTKFSNLDKYITLNKKGYIKIDTKTLPELDGDRAITMTGLNLVDGKNIIILVDGEEATKSQVSSIAYSNGTLTFEASEGSEFEVKPYLEVEECAIENGECAITGYVDDLCAEVSVELTNGKYSKQTLKEENFDEEDEGKFTYTITDLDASQSYDVKVSASNSGEVSNSVEWSIGDVSSSSPNLWLILLLLLLLGAAGGAGGYYYWKKKKGKTMSVEDQMTMEANSKDGIKKDIEEPMEDSREAEFRTPVEPTETKMRSEVDPIDEDQALPLTQPVSEE